jgi:hypothetical protein
MTIGDKKIKNKTENFERTKISYFYLIPILFLEINQNYDPSLLKLILSAK